MWKKISTKTIFRHPRLTLQEDTVRLPNGSEVPYLKIKPAHDSVTIICTNSGGEVLLQQEYSYPPNAVLYQFPGGKIEANESPERAAKRELLEESGLEVQDLLYLGWYFTNNRRSSEKMHVFLANDPAPSTVIGGDTEEDIVSLWVPQKKFTQMIADGEVINSSMLAAWAIFASR